MDNRLIYNSLPYFTSDFRPAAASFMVPAALLPSGEYSGGSVNVVSLYSFSAASSAPVGDARFVPNRITWEGILVCWMRGYAHGFIQDVRAERARLDKSDLGADDDNAAYLLAAYGQRTLNIPFWPYLCPQCFTESLQH